MTTNRRHADRDRFTKQAIIFAVITGWFTALFVDAVLSFRAGTLSITLQDVVKQGMAFLIGILAKTNVDPPQQSQSPVPVVGPDGGAVPVKAAEEKESET